MTGPTSNIKLYMPVYMHTVVRYHIINGLNCVYRMHVCSIGAVWEMCCLILSCKFLLSWLWTTLVKILNPWKLYTRRISHSESFRQTIKLNKEKVIACTLASEVSYQCTCKPEYVAIGPVHEETKRAVKILFHLDIF